MYSWLYIHFPSGVFLLEGPFFLTTAFSAHWHSCSTFISSSVSPCQRSVVSSLKVAFLLVYYILFQAPLLPPGKIVLISIRAVMKGGLLQLPKNAAVLARKKRHWRSCQTQSKQTSSCSKKKKKKKCHGKWGSYSQAGKFLEIWGQRLEMVESVEELIRDVMP